MAVCVRNPRFAASPESLDQQDSLACPLARRPLRRLPQGRPDLRRTLALNRPRIATMEQEVETRRTDVTPWSTIEHDLAAA